MHRTTNTEATHARRAQVVLEPRGDDLSAVTNATRWAALEAAASGYVTQVWTWRRGEAVVLNRTSSSWPGDWAVIVRRGLRRGKPQLGIRCTSPVLPTDGG
jgi:hypothetical protein